MREMTERFVKLHLKIARRLSSVSFSEWRFDFAAFELDEVEIAASLCDEERSTVVIEDRCFVFDDFAVANEGKLEQARERKKIVSQRSVLQHVGEWNLVFRVRIDVLMMRFSNLRDNSQTATL